MSSRHHSAQRKDCCRGEKHIGQDEKTSRFLFSLLSDLLSREVVVEEVRHMSQPGESVHKGFKNMKTLALQLYTVRDETARDFAGTLRRVSALGYTAVEFAGYGGLSLPHMPELLAETRLH